MSDSTDVLVSSLKPSLESFEGRSPWLYLDFLGHLTIGIGHLVHKKGGTPQALESGIKLVWSYGMTQIRADAGFAKEYLSVCRSAPPGPVTGESHAAVYNRTMKAAITHLGSIASYGSLLTRIGESTGAIAAAAADNPLVPGVWGYPLPASTCDQQNIRVLIQEAQSIEQLPVGWKLPVDYFECFNSFKLTAPAVDKLLQDDIGKKIVEVKGEPSFKEFDGFPVPAQVAVLDLSFQYGACGLSHQTAFAAAVKNKEWLAAEKACPTNDAQADRTKFRKNNLHQAAKP